MAQETVPVATEDPVLASAGAAIQQANQSVQAARAKLQATQPYSTGSQPQPQMPVPSQRSGLFQGASVKNLENQQPVTRAGARNKAVGMLAAQGARAIGSYFKKKEAEKTQALSMDIHRSLELQSGLDEANQAVEQAKSILANPNASPAEKQQAQQMLNQSQQAQQKNTKLLESLLNGKTGKDIAKAYDITFGDESKAKSMDDKSDSMHFQAMQSAMKQAKLDQAKMTQQANPMQPHMPNMGAPALPQVHQMSAMEQRGSDRLQKFQQGMPARIMQNPAYGQAYSAYQDAVKNATTVQKNVMDTYTKLHKDDTTLTAQGMKDKSAAERTAADNIEKTKVAQLKLQGDMTRAAATRANAWAKLQAASITRGGESIKAATDVYNQAVGSIKDIDKNIENIHKQQEEMLKNDTKDPVLAKQLNDNLAAYTQEREQQSQLQYAANLSMSSNPQGATLQSMILDPSRPKPATPTPVVAPKGPGLLERGLKIAKGVKSAYDDVSGNNKEPE